MDPCHITLPPGTLHDRGPQSWEKRKTHKEMTKPPTHQHVVNAGPTEEELKTENAAPSARSEHLSEHSLSQLQERNTAQAHQSAAQAQYSYAFEQRGAERDEEVHYDDDARSAATGMSGPSKYAPSAYAASSHHGGVTHDLMSQYEPSVYEADSTYDASLYGRESEYGDESSYSYNQDTRSSHRGGGYSDRGDRGPGRHQSGRQSIADTAAMSNLDSVIEDDRADSAYPPSESYMSSYVSSDDDPPTRSVQPRGGAGGGTGSGRSPTTGASSRHNVHRSGREMSGGRSAFSESTRHSGARSGFDAGDSREFDDDSYRGPGEDVEYYDNTSSSHMQGSDIPLADVDENLSEW